MIPLKVGKKKKKRETPKTDTGIVLTQHLMGLVVFVLVHNIVIELLHWVRTAIDWPVVTENNSALLSELEY